jgi:pyridoxal phosphate enzyme (YggS family)
MTPAPEIAARAGSAEGLAAVRRDIEAACRRANRDAGSVTLVAVSKTVAADAIEPIIAAGQRVFGENRVQEAKAKWPPLVARCPDLELHLIGPLQTNKAREAVALFDAIQTLDRPKLADVLRAEIDRCGRTPFLFVQVNTGEEPQKAGVAPREAGALIGHARGLGLPLKGLMCIPPAGENPAPHFALLAKLAVEHDLPLLSMGMSSDFEIAVRFGATHVRVGSAIFGERVKP